MTFEDDKRELEWTRPIISELETRTQEYLVKIAEWQEEYITLLEKELEL